MAYRFQTSKLRSTDFVDNKLLNQALTPVAEELAGNISEHNIKAFGFPNSKISPGAYQKFAFTSESVNPNIVANDIPGPGDANAYLVPDTYTWDRVGNMVLSPATGESILQIEGWLQYGLYVDFSVGGTQYRYDIFNDVTTLTTLGGGFTHSVFSGSLPRIQVAVRLDGVVIEQTITGVENIFDKAPKQQYPSVPTKGQPGAATALSIHTLTTDDTTSLQGECQPVRVGFHVPVNEGTHTVELVIRRVPIHDEMKIGKNKWAAVIQPQYMPVYVFSRKLITIEHPIHPASGSTGSTFAISGYNDGDVLTAGSLQTDRLFPIRNTINDLGTGNLARGALRAEHLPSRVLYPAQTHINSEAATSIVYPGFGVAAGWATVVDGAAVPLETTNGPYDFAANPAFSVVWADVQVRLIDFASTHQSIQAQFAIQVVYTDGTTETLGVDTAYINATNADATVGFSDMYEEFIPVHLLAYRDFRTVAPAKQIQKYRVVASTFNANIAGLASVYWYRGQISHLAWRP